MGILSYFVILSIQTHYKNQVICLIKYEDNAKNVFAKTVFFKNSFTKKKMRICKNIKQTGFYLL